MPRILFVLLVAMMMMPQISETLYSPALPSISSLYSVTPAVAVQTLSVYFFAFAFGVVCWGLACDYMGRRKSILLGLMIYFLGALFAAFAPNFTLLLGARIICAFGAAVGSVGTQTVMRDVYSGERLAKAFAIMGIALSLSPVIGMGLGGFLASQGGAALVFVGQIVLAALLLLWASMQLEETYQVSLAPKHIPAAALRQLISDIHIWRTAFLVALFNVMLYSFYAIAPFLYDGLGISVDFYGVSGVVLAVGGLAGAWLNHHAVSRQCSLFKQLFGAAITALLAGILVLFFNTPLIMMSVGFLLSLAYGFAIPALLSSALVNYRAIYGRAGAFLGLVYYIMIAAGLGIAGNGQNLGLTLIICAVLVFLTSCTKR